MSYNLTPDEKLRSNQRYLDRLYTKAVRMTFEEKETIQIAADQRGMSMNKFILDAALTFAELLSEERLCNGNE